MKHAYETTLTIDLKKLEHNYNYLKSLLNTNTEIIAVVKAFAYGHGDIKICKKLESIGVKTFWVADFEEGVNLRKNNISSNIIVANPGNKSIEHIIKYKLDIVIHNHHLLNYYINSNKKINAHIKFNTGMNRYGFDYKEIEDIAKKIKENSFLNIKSICSHLSSADDVNNIKFNLNQINNFKKVSSKFERLVKKKINKHLLNSHGVLNFSEYQFNQVRIGIGLYGGINNENLSPIGKFNSVIAESRDISKGESIGYSSSFVAKKSLNISVIPVGYADGLNRNFGNNIGRVLIDGKLCPIVGDISMDSFIADTSEINCKVGDNVEIFGPKNSVLNLSKRINTIPYEIYSTLNRRIKRIYVDD